MLVPNEAMAGTNLQYALAMRRFFPLLVRKRSEMTVKGLVISIIDDNASIRMALKRLIESTGLPAEEFASAEEFLVSCRSQDSACLILDLQLPGMSGLELQSQLHVSNPGVPIVFISASFDEQARARALRTGAIEFLQKPFSAEALFEAIKTSLSIRGSSASAYFEPGR
jgi:FixJ family two-component response regulator